MSILVYKFVSHILRKRQQDRMRVTHLSNMDHESMRPTAQSYADVNALENMGKRYTISNPPLSETR